MSQQNQIFMAYKKIREIARIPTYKYGDIYKEPQEGDSKHLIFF